VLVVCGDRILGHMDLWCYPILPFFLKSYQCTAFFARCNQYFFFRADEYEILG